MVAAATLVLNNLRPMRALALNMVVVNIKAVTQALVIKTAAVEAAIQAAAVEAVTRVAAVEVDLAARLLLHGKRMSIRMSNFPAQENKTDSTQADGVTSSTDASTALSRTFCAL